MDMLTTITLIAAAIAMAALAAWILYLKASSRANWTFATYLLVFATAQIARATWINLAPGPSKGVWELVLLSLNVATLAALACFGIAFFGWRRGHALRSLEVGVLVLGLLLSVLHWIDPCLYKCSTATGEKLGPLTLLGQSPALATGILALLLAFDWLKRGKAPGQSGTMLLSVAFMVNALFIGSLSVVPVIQKGWASLGLWESMLGPWRVLPLIVALPTLTIFHAGWRKGLLTTAQVTAIEVFAAVALGSGIAMGALPPEGSTTAVSGAWRIAVPVLAAYALVRHRLFGIEITVRQTLGRVILAAVLLSLIFGLSWAAESVWVGSGMYVALAAAAVLAFAIAPLDRAGQRIAQALMPQARPSKELDVKERLALYRDRVTTLLADGRMAVHDRVLLDNLRNQLMLPTGWASRIEREAWAQASKRRGGPTGPPPWVDPPTETTR